MGNGDVFIIEKTVSLSDFVFYEVGGSIQKWRSLSKYVKESL